jgi:hypothetical protein
VGTIDPDGVRFSRNSIKATFREGGTIDPLAEGLRTGVVNAEHVPSREVIIGNPSIKPGAGAERGGRSRGIASGTR